MMSLLLGILAGVLCTVSFIPQVVKIYETKNARDISLPTFIIFAAGVSCWLLYGILIRQLPIIIANAATLLLALTIVGMKVAYRRRGE